MLSTQISVFSDSMAKERADSVQKNLRLSAALVARMRAYMASHPLKPTATQIAEAAITEFLDRASPPAAKVEKRKASG